MGPLTVMACLGLTARNLNMIIVGGSQNLPVHVLSALKALCRVFEREQARWCCRHRTCHATQL